MILLFCGCATSKKYECDWEYPQIPIEYKVNFKPVAGGYFIAEEDAANLAVNIEEKNAYIEKQKILIDEILRFYQ